MKLRFLRFARQQELIMDASLADDMNNDPVEHASHWI
jgi:hypothetical protein